MRKILISVVLYKPNLEDFNKLFNSITQSNLTDSHCDVCFLDNSTGKSNFIEEAVELYSDNKQGSKLKMHYILSYKNLGYGAGHNFVYREYSGRKYDYFLIINPDVHFKQDLIRSLCDRIEAERNVSLASVRVLNPDNSTQYVHRKFPKLSDVFIRILTHFIKDHTIRRAAQNRMSKVENRSLYIGRQFQAECISGCFMCFKSDVFAQLNGFDERFFIYYEDADISKRSYSFGKNMVFSDLNIYHKWNRDSTKNLSISLVHLFSMFRYFILHPLLNFFK